MYFPTSNSDVAAQPFPLASHRHTFRASDLLLYTFCLYLICNIQTAMPADADADTFANVLSRSASFLQLTTLFEKAQAILEKLNKRFPLRSPQKLLILV